jgi:hypothetical protein
VSFCIEARGESEDRIGEGLDREVTESVLDFGMDLGDETDEVRMVVSKFSDFGVRDTVEEEETDIAVGDWVIVEEILGGFSLGRETGFELGDLGAVDGAELDSEVMGLGIGH